MNNLIGKFEYECAIFEIKEYGEYLEVHYPELGRSKLIGVSVRGDSSAFYHVIDEKAIENSKEPWVIIYDVFRALIGEEDELTRDVRMLRIKKRARIKLMNYARKLAAEDKTQ